MPMPSSGFPPNLVIGISPKLNNKMYKFLLDYIHTIIYIHISHSTVRAHTSTIKFHFTTSTGLQVLDRVFGAFSLYISAELLAVTDKW